MNTQSSPPLMSNEDNNEADLDMQPAKGKAAKNRRKRNASKKKASTNMDKQQLHSSEAKEHEDKPPSVEETPPVTTGADAKANATQEAEVEPATSSVAATATTPPAEVPASSTTATTTNEAPTEAKADLEGDQLDGAGVEESRRYKSHILSTFMREVDRLNSMMRNLLVRARLKYYKMATKHHDTSVSKSEKQAAGAEESMLENEELFNETATEKLIEPDKNKGGDESKISMKLAKTFRSYDREFNLAREMVEV